MKMRKLLPLVLLAVGSLFLLSSCDAMLDAIFPSNVINIDVWVQASTHADFLAGGSYENVTLMDSNLAVVANVSQYYSSYDGFYVHYYFSFAKLNNGTYYLTTTYIGQFTGIHATNGNVYDSSGYFLGSSLTFPDRTLGDSSGHTANIRMLAS